MSNTGYKIYKHTLLIGPHTGWGYIGLTSKANPNKRWRDGKGYKYCKKFYNAIKKYGWNNFKHEIIEDNIKTGEEANSREIYWIAYYHTWVGDPKCKGYNISKGGSNCKVRLFKENDSICVWSADIDSYLEQGWHLADKLEYKHWFRYTTGYYEKEKERKREDYHNNIEVKRKKQRDYYKQNAEKIKERSRNNYKKNGKERYQKNRQRRLACSKKYYNKIKNNPDFIKKHKEANRRWRLNKLKKDN